MGLLGATTYIKQVFSDLDSVGLPTHIKYMYTQIAEFCKLWPC